MKRFHVNVAVDDIEQSVRFYSALFAAEPTVLKADYAKWMLEDPRVNFSLSAGAMRAAGISHLGIQAENEGELAEVFDRLASAERPILEEKGATCCYAQSDKQWVTDPQGVVWETFYTYGESTIYGRHGAAARVSEMTAQACSCSPVEQTLSEKAEGNACCVG
jgi:catechol 2,3-dioxygenase-like lactoylglutathione lyase family enzyme